MTQLPTTPYLDRPRPRKHNERFVGGTLIATHIETSEQQVAALADPDRVRPRSCQACRWPRLHVHERRTRLLGGLGSGRIQILIFRCANRPCRVVWRVLPAFMARYLWRRWSQVSAALDEGSSRRPVPKRTRRRWRRRLREQARMLVVVLAQLGPRQAPALARIGLGASRGEVIGAFGLQRLAELAALVDHLAAGVRVM